MNTRRSIAGLPPHHDGLAVSVISSFSRPPQTNAPVPTGWRFTYPAPCSRAFGDTMEFVNIASSERKNGGIGSLNSNRTVRTSTAVVFATNPNMSPQYGYRSGVIPGSVKWNGCFRSRCRSKFTATAAASQADPSWKRTPSRRVNVMARRSAAASQATASAGSIALDPYLNRTSVS